MIRAASRWIVRPRVFRAFAEADGSSAFSKVSAPAKSKEQIEKEKLIRGEIREAMDAWAKKQGLRVPKLLGVTFFAITVPSFIMGFCLVMTPYEDLLFLEYLERSFYLIATQNLFFVASQ